MNITVYKTKLSCSFYHFISAWISLLKYEKFFSRFTCDVILNCSREVNYTKQSSGLRLGFNNAAAFTML